MKAKGLAFAVVVGLGLPAFIIYNILYQRSDSSFPPIEDFENISVKVQALSNDQYQVLNVHDQDGMLRVNVVVSDPATDREGARMQALNALYDIQSLVGRELSVAVWTYENPRTDLDSLEGLAFFRSLTQQTVFKTADELR